MKAVVYLHPRSCALNLRAMLSNLKARGYDVPFQPEARYLIAHPEPGAGERRRTVREDIDWWPR